MIASPCSRITDTTPTPDHRITDMPDTPVKGPASYFPSIEKTYGQPVQHWLSLLDTVKDRKHMEQVAFLKSEHKIGHGHANALVAHHRAQHGG